MELWVCVALLVGGYLAKTEVLKRRSCLRLKPSVSQACGSVGIAELAVLEPAWFCGCCPASCPLRCARRLCAVLSGCLVFAYPSRLPLPVLSVLSGVVCPLLHLVFVLFLRVAATGWGKSFPPSWTVSAVFIHFMFRTFVCAAENTIQDKGFASVS